MPVKCTQLKCNKTRCAYTAYLTLYRKSVPTQILGSSTPTDIQNPQKMTMVATKRTALSFPIPLLLPFLRKTTPISNLHPPSKICSILLKSKDTCFRDVPVRDPPVVARWAGQRGQRVHRATSLTRSPIAGTARSLALYTCCVFNKSKARPSPSKK